MKLSEMIRRKLNYVTYYILLDSLLDIHKYEVEIYYKTKIFKNSKFNKYLFVYGIPTL